MVAKFLAKISGKGQRSRSDSALDKAEGVQSKKPAPKPMLNRMTKTTKVIKKVK